MAERVATASPVEACYGFVSQTSQQQHACDMVPVWQCHGTGSMPTSIYLLRWLRTFLKVCSGSVGLCGFGSGLQLRLRLRLRLALRLGLRLRILLQGTPAGLTH